MMVVLLRRSTMVTTIETPVWVTEGNQGVLRGCGGAVRFFHTFAMIRNYIDGNGNGSTASLF